MKNDTEVVFLDVWLAHGDGGERSTGPVIAICSTQIQAEQAAHNQGWYGGNGYVCSNKAVRIDGATYLLGNAGQPVDLNQEQKIRDDQLRARTLDILSSEQKTSTGLEMTDEQIKYRLHEELVWEYPLTSMQMGKLLLPEGYLGPFDPNKFMDYADECILLGYKLGLEDKIK